MEKRRPVNHLLLICLAGLAAGGVNAVAGGGSFISVPALIYVGIPATSANMSSTIALYPGTLTSGWAYRGNVQAIFDIPLKALFFTTLAGGSSGAALLLFTPDATLEKAIPWLLLFGSVAFAFGPAIGDRLCGAMKKNPAVVLLTQFGLGVYAGYFGGAVGIMMMAMWSLLGLSDVRRMNATRVVLVAAANTIAVLCFALIGSIAWRETLTMMATAVVGGYLGAKMALSLAPSVIRAGISAVNFVIVALLFFSTYVHVH
jgi:uncharacterized protein